MKRYMKTNTICTGLFCALALTACSEDKGVSQSCGTTEENNAIWFAASKLDAWSVIGDSKIDLNSSKKNLAGRVTLARTSGEDGLSRAGMVFDASNPDGSPADLSQNSDGICVTYASDLNVEIRLDANDHTDASLDRDLPYANFTTKEDGKQTQCVSWKDFMMRKTSSDDKPNLNTDSFAKKVRSVQIVFAGESGASGEFDIQRFSPYVRWDMWIGKDGEDHVNTGFNEGDNGTSGELSLFGDSSVAYIDLHGANKYNTLADLLEYSEGFDGNVIFENTSSNPDVGIQFLVAGKTVGEDEVVLHSADVSTKWKGLCLEYESEMNIEMALVHETATEEKSLKITFAKNNDMETKCVEFEDLQDPDAILKNLTTVRMKFVNDNKAGTHFEIRRISYLLPEDRAVRDLGEYRDITPTVSSDYKSGTSFLWNGAVDGAQVNTGIENAPESGIWINTAEDTDDYSMNFPDDVNADDNGNFIPSLVGKYHKLTSYVKTMDESGNLNHTASIGFNTVNSNLEPADISAWGGFCIHYQTYSEIRIAIITDASAGKYWYADVNYSDDMVWGKVSWNAFKNFDEDSNEGIEDVIGKITEVRLLFTSDGKYSVDKFGSYDQCGN